MRRVVISTVGISLLTNQSESKAERDSLYNEANCKDNKISPEVKALIIKLKEKAIAKLNGEVEAIRKASAELNGIYGLYQERLEQGSGDMHWLIATDTAQGKETAKIVESFLQSKGLTAQVYIPKGFSTASTGCFSDGIDELLTQLETMTDGYDKVCFNLVGGFKSLQAYLNTIGMFYANEIIYIFEGGSSEVITIPRLPIKIDESVIEPYKVQFALMAADAEVKLSQLTNIQEALIYKVDDEVTLSNWGKLVWNQSKRELLSQDLLEFPCLFYENTFIKDYQKNNVNAQRKLELQEVLAEVSGSMLKFNRDTTRFDTRLHFTRYEGGKQCEGGIKKNQIDHFYIKNTGWRVSCITKNGKLHLRHYGEHDYVNDKP